MDEYTQRASALLEQADADEIEVAAENGSELYQLQRAFLSLGCQVVSHISELKIKVFKPVTRERDNN